MGECKISSRSLVKKEVFILVSGLNAKIPDEGRGFKFVLSYFIRYFVQHRHIMCPDVRTVKQILSINMKKYFKRF